MAHSFTGKWITDAEFAGLQPRNVFHRQLEKLDLPCNEHRNRHILFRKSFSLDATGRDATLYISADDYYKLYINGQFVAQGPTPAYHFQYNYNVLDVSRYLRAGENVIAVHTLYHGLINRVWQSGDGRHGLILDLCIDGKTVIASDESFKTTPHTAYTETGVVGYETQFMERYDARDRQVGFVRPDFDDSAWANASLAQYADHTLVEQPSKMLVFEQIQPIAARREGNRILYDFGSTYVGYLCATARGNAGDTVTVRCAQELSEDGRLRYRLRANCLYEEEWILAGGESALDWFDYKSFRYAELELPEGVEVRDVCLVARHYPFELRAKLKPEYADHAELQKIWSLCVHTLQYGIQEVIQDCMEREKGFYLGDGCYTALTHMILTGDDSMVRRLIDDAFSTSFITDTLMTCMNCSMMQEIAEYPLILVYLLLWHYRLTGDRDYLRQNYEKASRLLDAYRRDYEKGHLLRDLNKWCVVEWPKNFQHDYDVDIREGKVCHEAHVSLNAYYLAALHTANEMAAILGLPQYRDAEPVRAAFFRTFWNDEQKLFRDGESTEHISLVGNSFVYAFGLCDDEDFDRNFLAMLTEHGIHSLSLFCTFPTLMGLARHGRFDLIRDCLLDEGAWLRILREDGTTTFEGWGRDTKWNTSLFHL
ncbi:MAG: family 78 glycoside hydrolase catalytic domain, partial [Clostridia bacterium]|nr:family 78 glycoside hydrolase catalytic domain [Clostridia bacterium]